MIVVNLDERCHRNGVLRLQGVGGGSDSKVLRAASGSRVLDMPTVPGVMTCVVVEPVHEQLVVWVKMVKLEGHVLLESRGDDDTENDVEEVNAVISGCLPLVYDAGDAVGDLARDGDHRGRVEQRIVERDNNVGCIGPRGDGTNPNALHECATSVGEDVVGTAALQKLQEDVTAFARVGAAPHPSRVAGGTGTGAVWDTVEHLMELVRQPEVVMWRGRAAAPVSTIIAVEDVEATMVAAVSEAAGLPPGSAAVPGWYSAVPIASMAAARASSGSSMWRRYLQRWCSVTASSADEIATWRRPRGLRRPVAMVWILIGDAVIPSEKGSECATQMRWKVASAVLNAAGSSPSGVVAAV
jgi:hypothetical protein